MHKEFRGDDGWGETDCNDPRLSNTAAMADHWLPTWPGSEPALFLAWAKMILELKLYDREFMETR